MISFAPDDDERLLADSARAFAQAQLRPRLRAHEQARAVHADVRAAFHALGMVGLDLPEALGFGGLSLTTRALIEEELAAGDPGAAFALDAPGLAGQLIAALGSREQQARWLSGFMTDPQSAAACALSGECTARQDGAAWVISGEKRHVLGGRRAGFFVVSSVPGLFVLESSGALRVEEDPRPLGLAELPPCTVRFDAARAERLGEGDFRPQLRAALLRQAAVAAARAIGCSRSAFEVARRYAEERSAFGKPIGHFQAIAFLLADMATELDGARVLLWRGCRAADGQAADAPLRLSQAVAQTRDASFFITESAVQILGGAGYLQDHPVEKWMRDCRAIAQYALPAEAASSISIAAHFDTEPADDDVFCFRGAQQALT